MALGAKFIIKAINLYQDDAKVKDYIENVNLQSQFDAFFIRLTICYDQTIIGAPGIILREVRVPFTPEFLAAHPTTPLQEEALLGFCRGQFTAQCPATVGVSMTIEDVNCP